MTDKPQHKKGLKAAVKKWSDTPAENPRYKGATPGDVARALLGKHTTPKGREDGPPIKTDV